MTKQEILNAIQEYITGNGLQAITGSIMNSILTAIANIIPDDALLTSSFGGIVSPAGSIVVTPGQQKWFFANPGTYPNANNLTFSDDKIGILSYNGSEWESIEINIPISKPKKVPFTAVVKLDELRKYAVINQSGDINFTYDPTGIEIDGMYNAQIISDGISAINFTSDFDVIGEVDPAKNQSIFFSRSSVVEFKPTALIMNITKSGQTTPIQLTDADAQSFVDDIAAAGGNNLTTGQLEAIDNFFIAAKEDGFYGVMKGLYWGVGSTQASRLLNAVPGKPPLIQVSGTVDNDGFKGVFNTQLVPATEFDLNSYAYGFENKTFINEDTASMGCGDSNGQLVFIMSSSTIGGAGRAAMIGTNSSQVDIVINQTELNAPYFIIRTSASSQKWFKDTVEKSNQTTSQAGSSLPNVPIAFGGYNNNGVWDNDGRTHNYGVIFGNGVTEQNIMDFNARNKTLLAALKP